jgi:hypothetical protein
MLYARDGVRIFEVPEAQQAWIRLRRGRTLALVRGQERASRDELESLRATLQERGFPGQSALDAADMMEGIGVGLNGIGAYAEAHGVLAEAITLLGDSSPYLRSRSVAQQVIAALGMSQPALAAGHMVALVHVAPLVDSRRLDNYLKDVLARSARWAAVPEVRDARDRLKPLVLVA